MPASTHTTPGDFIATELIAAKAKGQTFHHPQLSAFIDVCLEQWNQANGFTLEAATDAIPATQKPAKARSTIPPAPEDVTLYFKTIGYPVSGQEFCDRYAQNGWMVGKNRMKDWQAACRNWKTNGWGKPTSAPANTARDYSKV